MSVHLEHGTACVEYSCHVGAGEGALVTAGDNGEEGGVGSGGVVVDDLLYAGGFGGGWEGVGGYSAILSGGEAEEDAEGGGEGNDDGDPSCDDAFIHISTVRGG